MLARRRQMACGCLARVRSPPAPSRLSFLSFLSSARLRGPERANDRSDRNDRLPGARKFLAEALLESPAHALFLFAPSRLSFLSFLSSSSCDRSRGPERVNDRNDRSDRNDSLPAVRKFLTDAHLESRAKPVPGLRLLRFRHDKNDRNDNDFQGGMHALPVARSSREPVGRLTRPGAPLAVRQSRDFNLGPVAPAR